MVLRCFIDSRTIKLFLPSLFLSPFWQSTTWVKRESEKQAKLIAENPDAYPVLKAVDLTACFLEDADGNNAQYITRCIDDHVLNLRKAESDSVTDNETDTETESENDTDSTIESDNFMDEDSHPEL